jgi:DNA-binding MarR family transcriptional regulator
MRLRAIPHIHRATHHIGLHIAELDDPVVNQAEAHVLAHLAASGDATIGDVHRAFGHRRSTLTSILDRLERRKLVVRSSDPRDRRTFRIALTKSGIAAAERVISHLARLEAVALRGVSASELRTFLRVLGRFETTDR